MDLKEFLEIEIGDILLGIRVRDKLLGIRVRGQINWN